MLSPDDRQVAERDQEVGGLPLLLDAEAMAEWLSDRTGQECVVDGQRMRYKPGTSCTLAFRLGKADGETVRCLAKTYATTSAAKADKTMESAPDAVLAFEPTIGLVVTTLAGDRDLPALARLYDGPSRARLLDRTLPGLNPGSDTALETLRHNPERRWVGVLDTADGGRILLRAYRHTESYQHRRAYRVLSGGEPRTPALLGRTRRYDLIAVEWIAGAPLSALPPEPTSFEAAGRAVAQLHAGPTHRRLGLRGPDAEAADARAAADEVARLLPHLAPHVLDVATRCASRLEELRHHKAMLHGDFSTDQVVIGVDGRATLIDLDAACVGDPAIDLACASALLAHHGAPDYVRMPAAAVEALYEGYQSVLPLPSPERLATHTAAHLLRKAVDPFRNREPGWPRHTERLVDLADHQLQTHDERGWATW